MRKLAVLIATVAIATLGLGAATVSAATASTTSSGSVAVGHSRTSDRIADASWTWDNGVDTFYGIELWAESDAKGVGSATLIYYSYTWDLDGNTTGATSGWFVSDPSAKIAVDAKLRSASVSGSFTSVDDGSKLTVNAAYAANGPLTNVSYSVKVNQKGLHWSNSLKGSIRPAEATLAASGIPFGIPTSGVYTNAMLAAASTHDFYLCKSCTF